MPHVRALDGLRGVAVLSVILFHFGYFTAGWIGVQIFFVLSGYLITGILVAEREQPAGFFFRRFYWRRSLRIFPLYFGYLAALTVLFLATNAPAAFAHRWAYLYSYTYNYALLLVPLEQSPAFTHFWSLAVEEQFYLLWPLLVYYLPKPSVKALIGVILLASPLYRLVEVMAVHSIAPGHPEPGLFAYSPLAAQLDALATGAGVSLVNHRDLRHPTLALLIATIGVLGLGLMNGVWTAGEWGPAAGCCGSIGKWLWAQGTSFGYRPFATSHYQHVWSYSAINLWSAVLLMNLVRGGALARVFGHRVLASTGKISYGLYVFHYPLLGLVKSAVYFAPVSARGVGFLARFLAGGVVHCGGFFREILCTNTSD
jgi:peptidoglycan/LPS O-acetylase OafA/YrhL